jgi:tetratricopeptide (TPR) repeat protein
VRLRALLLSIAFVLNGCTFSLDWVRQIRAQRAIARQDYASALPLLQQIVDLHPEGDRSLEAARAGARAAHLSAKNYPLAVKFYRYLVMKSESPAERKDAQKAIAQIYYENLQDLDQAIIEYEKLLKLDNTPEEAVRFRLNLAKCHLGLNNADQALIELNAVLEKKPPEDVVFDVKMLKANVLVASKQLVEATALWESILKDFPERSAKENVAMNMVVVYEELKEFGKAIAVLETMRADYPNPKFLDQRIERLKERQYNQPGAQGFKR